MKTIRLTTILLLILTIFSFSGTSQVISSRQDFFSQTDVFLKRFVQKGQVDYASIKQDQDQLHRLISFLADNGTKSVQNMSDEALLINAYNIFVIKGIVEAYPVKSPQNIPSFFDRKAYFLGNKATSLNELEKEILIPATQDARLHFALVCAAQGCPELAMEPFVPSKLDAQLTARARFALNDPGFIKVSQTDQKVEISQLFDWYKSDFTKGKKSVLEYINSFRNDPIPSNYKVSFYNYNWKLNDKQVSVPARIEQDPIGTSNLLRFTPSQLFANGQFEINWFNNLYSQTAIRNSNGDKIETGVRQSILTSSLQVTAGISESRRINVGADIVFSAGSVGPAENSSMFQLFGSNVAARDVAVTGIGPRIKFQPVARWTYFSVQSTFLFPVASDPEGQTASRDVFLALNRYVWRNQFYYDLKLSNKFRLFSEFDVNYFIRRNQSEVFYVPNFVDLPVTAFLNYFPTPKLNLYINGQYAPRIGATGLPEEENRQTGLLQWSTSIGGGAKYQLTNKLNLELGYGNFIASQGVQGFEGGAGQVVNFAVRYITN